MILGKYRIVKRKTTNIALELLTVAVAIILSFIVSAALIASYGANPLDALHALFRGAFGSRYAILETLVQATPLIFTGLGVVIAFRAKLFNIGAEGQLWAGAIGAAFISMKLAFLPRPILLPLIILGSAIFGGFWGFIPGYLKAKFETNEIIVTVMLNYLITYVTSYLVSGPWREPGQYYLQTFRFAESARMPTFFDSRIHLGLFLALGVSILMYIVLWKTPFGFDIRALGSNPTASKYRGVKTQIVIVLIMIISGAISGLAGGMEVSGLHYRLKMDISNRFGFTGLLVAQLGKLHPFGVVLAAIFFGALVNGSTGMQIFTGVPVSLVYSVQGISLIFLLASEAFARYRIIRAEHD